mgnify:FL=1
MQKTITKTLILAFVLTAALGVNYLFAAWTGPTQAPTGGNTSTPVHVGTTDQVKNGGLSVDALSVFGGGYFQGSVQVGNSGADPQAGTIRWNGTDLEVYKINAWVSLTGTGATACTSFTYSAWGECQSNSTQTRTVTSSSPDGCVVGNPVTSQSCTYILPMSTQCQNVGGSWVASQNTCYFPNTSCPGGWSPNANYSSVTGRSCSGDCRTWSPYVCSVPGHFRQNAGNTCSYIHMTSYSGRNPGCRGSAYVTCTATQTEIGCTKN